LEPLGAIFYKFSQYSRLRLAKAAFGALLEFGMSEAAHILGSAMRKRELSEQLARESHLSKAKDADRLDRVIHDLVQRLRKGETVTMPGLGPLTSTSQRRRTAAKDGHK
jgi:hypothetical protein